MARGLQALLLLFGEAARECKLRKGRTRAPWVVVSSQEGTGGDPQHTEQHTALKAPPPQTALQTHPARQLYLKPAPWAAVGAGQLEGKRSGVTQQMPAVTPPPPPSPGHPIAPSCRDLGWAGAGTSRAPTVLEPPTSTRTDRHRPTPSTPGAHMGILQPRQACPLH